MTIDRIGVIGAGTVGRGVAQEFAQGEFEVVLVDIDQAQLDHALTDIERNLRMQSLFTGNGEPRYRTRDVLGRIKVGTDLALVGATEFVVENVTEDWTVKKEIYRALDEICKPGVIFAANTSAIPITRIASATGRSTEVLGMHFMNPVPLMTMVEVIRGYYTSDETLDTALGLLDRLGKDGVVVNDGPGFVTNRVLMSTINEAIYCVQDHVASASDVDRIFRGCFGHKMGPLETGDLIGLDTILNSITVLYESYRDSKYRPAPLLQQMVDAGLLGRKSGRGFYEYRTDCIENGE